MLLCILCCCCCAFATFRLCVHWLEWKKDDGGIKMFSSLYCFLLLIRLKSTPQILYATRHTKHIFTYTRTFCQICYARFFLLSCVTNFLNDFFSFFSALHRNLDRNESLSDPQLICDIIHL